jgi:hypothetical protein
MKQHLRARNKRQQLKAEARRSKLVAAPADATVQTLAGELSVSKRTIFRDLQTMRQQLNAQNLTEYEQRRNAHEQELQLMLDHLLQSDELTDAELGKLFRDYKADIAKLRGLNAESRAVVAHVSTNVDKAYLEFKKHTTGLDEGQVEQVLNFAASLERKRAVKDATWFPPPEPKQLTDGDPDETA